jgi:hypothetical protein
MKKLITILALAFAVTVIQTGCGTPVAQRTQAVQTLEIVGQTAKTAIQASATLLAKGQITVAQWNQISTIYDTQFQPAYAIAVQAVNSDLSSVASPDIAALAGQIAALATSFATKTP